MNFYIVLLKRIFLNGKFDYNVANPPKNKDDYKKMRNDIIAKVNEFIRYTEDPSLADEDYTKVTYSEEEKKDWQYNLMKFTLNKWLYDNRNYTQELKNQTIEAKYKAPIKRILKKILR